MGSLGDLRTVKCIAGRKIEKFKDNVDKYIDKIKEDNKKEDDKKDHKDDSKSAHYCTEIEYDNPDLNNGLGHLVTIFHQKGRELV